MGWSSGSEIAEDVWTNIREHLPEGKRQELAGIIVSIFESYDCDTMYEAETLMADAAAPTGSADR